jgi:hypothetical protein
LRQPFQLVRPECLPCTTYLSQTYDTKPVYLVRDLIEARLAQPNVAYCKAGGYHCTDRRCHVIEAVLVGTALGGDSIDPVPADGAESNAIDDPR